MSDGVGQRGLSVVDALLILVIISSLGLIVTHFFNAQTSDKVKVATSPPSIPALVRTAQRRPLSPTDLTFYVPPVISDEAWSKLLTEPAFTRAKVKRSDGCAINFGQTQWGLSVDHAPRVQQIREGQPQVLWGFDEFPCVEVNQRLHLVNFKYGADQPVVEFLATMLVVDVLSIEVKLIPTNFFQSQNTSLSEFEKFFSALRKSSPTTKDNILRLRPIASEPIAASIAPALSQKAKVILKAARGDFYKQFPKALIVDVRSPQEFATGTLPHAVNVPFELESPGSNGFRWNMLNKDISNASFDFQKIEREADGRPVVIVGGPPSDGRAFWAAHFLSQLSFSKLFFFYDGVQ